MIKLPCSILIVIWTKIWLYHNLRRIKRKTLNAKQVNKTTIVTAAGQVTKERKWTEWKLLKIYLMQKLKEAERYNWNAFWVAKKEVTPFSNIVLRHSE